jgi:phage terminase small subunit
MGKRGPRPQPTVLKGLRGTLRTKDRRRGPDALAPAGSLTVPGYFTSAQRARWEEILRAAPLNVLRPIDAAILTDFILSETLAEQAYLACNGELTVEGEKSTARNPVLLVYFKAVEAKRAAMRELGFTPAARVGLPIDDSSAADPEDDYWAEILNPPPPTPAQLRARKRLMERVARTVANMDGPWGRKAEPPSKALEEKVAQADAPIAAKPEGEA